MPVENAELKALNPDFSTLIDSPNSPNDFSDDSSSRSDSADAKGLRGSVKRVRTRLFSRKKRNRRNTLTLDPSMKTDLDRLRKNREIKDRIMRQRTVRALTQVKRPKRKVQIIVDDDVSCFMRCRQRIRAPKSLRCGCQVILVTIMLVIVNLHAVEKTYKRHARSSFLDLFAVHPVGEPVNSEFEQPFLMSTFEVENAVKQVSTTFWNIQNSSVDFYSFTKEEGSNIRVIIENLDGIQEQYTANESYPGPIFDWSNTTLDEHVEEAYSISLWFEAETYVFRNNLRYCHHWSFDYRVVAHFGDPDLGNKL
jgi:hypothetical protein